MMNNIQRQICVTRQAFQNPICIVEGTGTLPVSITVTDYQIPAGSTATAYNQQPDGTLVKQLCTISENVIVFTPPAGFYVHGLNKTQIRITYNNLDLFSFVINALVDENIVGGDDGEEINNNPSLLAQVLSQYGQMNSHLDQQISELDSKIDVERQRINQFVALPEGSTTGDAELMDIRVGADGKTYDSAGDAVREQIKSMSKIVNDDLSIDIFSFAQAVEAVFKNVVFRSANTQAYDYLSNVVQQLKPDGMVSVKYSLTNCTINTSVAYVMKGSSFTATITPNDNTEFQSLTVTMGGSDVTETVVEDKTINITNVTGDVVIIAIAKSLFLADGYEALGYVYSSGNGDAYIDTDWIMTDLKEKIVVGVQLSETNPTSKTSAFLGVNADSAFSSIYTAIELGQEDVGEISVGWGTYQPISNSFTARYNEDLKSKIHYVSLTNGEQQLWEDEDMNSLYTGQFASNTQKYTMDDSRIPPFPVWLFRSNIQDVAYQSATKKAYRSPGVKISCFKVYDGDGILTVNMRAAKRSNDGVVGFYDTVRKRFFENACDTGELIGG